MPLIVLYVGTAMLLIAAAPLPYGYYTLLRIAAFGIFGFAAFISFDRKYKLLPWAFILLAIIFNPIIKVHFSKELWALIDIAAGIFLLSTARLLKRET
jgi:prepilin signal peptidase PulO-like enzyme (type II secretory pathway)